MKPLLAHIFSPSRWTDSTLCHVQPKYDGVRALYQNGRFQSRDGIPWAPNKLEHIAAELRQLLPPNIILDGELYRHGWPLGRINGAVAVNSNEVTSDTLEIKYHVFDVVDYLTPFDIRYSTSIQFKLALLSNSTAVPTQRVCSYLTADDFYADCVDKGFEGIMYRLGDCIYTKPKQPWHSVSTTRIGRSPFASDKDNRVWHLLKRKDWKDDEFEIVEVEEGVGKRSGMVGALVCLTHEGKHFRVGSGLSDQEATEWLQNPPKGRKAKVKFRVYTSDGIPFNPTLICLI